MSPRPLGFPRGTVPGPSPMSWGDRVERAMGPLLVVGAVLGIVLPGPGRGAAGAGGIEAALALLVATSAMSIPPAELAQAASSWRRLLLALGVSALALPVLGLAVGSLAPRALARSLGVVGLAPSEVASIAVAQIARGSAPLAAGMVLGTTALTLAEAAPLLALAGYRTHLNPLALLATLATVVAAPLAVGVALARLGPRVSALGRAVSPIALALLIWEVASELRPGASPLLAIAISIALVGAAGLVGLLATVGAGRSERIAIVAATGMRDFAVAAGIAASAFGPQSVGPLAAYGLVAIGTGALAARLLGRAGA